MPSRVIHIRLDDWVLLGCHDVMKAGKDPVANVPMSTIVRQVVTSLIRKLQNTNQIPTYTKEEAIERAMELYGGAQELDLDVSLEDIVSIEQKEEEEDMAALVKETLREIEQEGAPEGIAEDVHIGEATEIPEAEIPTINLYDQEALPFSYYQKQAPKDRFIEWATNEDNSLIQKAVCLVYDGLPKQMWGTEKAEDMIKYMLERHRVD